MIDFFPSYVQKNLTQQYNLSTSPRPLTPYTEGGGANTTHLRPTQRNRRSNNDVT